MKSAVARCRLRLGPCPNCGTDSGLAVYSYDNGRRHVECDKCFYLGPGEGSIRAAIKSHNDRMIAKTAAA